MSNMIKAYSVRYDEEAKKSIDSHVKKETEIQLQRNIRLAPLAPVEDSNGFVEGLQAVAVDVVDPIVNEEEIQEKSSKILENARAEAKSILDKAKQEADKLKADTLALAKQKGYEEGMQQGQREVQKRIAEYEVKERKLQEEYDAMLASLEPDVMELMVSLIEKITGILVEDKRDVILYLVEKAFKNMDRAEEFTIRVGKEDYEYLSTKQEELINYIGREIRIFIEETPGLKKNQCLIETEQRVIDCSLDVQMSKLITDIKLLSRI